MTRTVLSFDTSAAHCAVAVLSDDRILAEAFEEMSKGQAERLMPLVAGVLDSAGAVPGDLDAIGVGIGPGNFTGVRISVAAARGLALALGRPAIGVSSLEALGHGMGDVLAIRAASRGDVYLQRFGAAPRGPAVLPLAEVGPDWRAPRITGDHADDLAARVGAAVMSARPIAPTIARIAAARCDTPLPRPAPLYLRQADAAPARDAGPVILPC